MAEKMKKKKRKKREQGNNILCTPCLSFLELDTYSGQLNEEKRNSIDRDQGGPQCVTDRNGIIERFFQGDYNEDRVTKEHQAGSSTFSFLLYEYRKRNSY